MPDKLVRDGIPDVIRASGETPIVRRCVDLDERRRRLIEKLGEETGEYADSVRARDVGDLTELADIAEVVEALAFLDGYSLPDVLRAKAVKQAKVGGFAEGWVWSGNVSATPPAV